jgi:hypothetical protein
VCRNRRLDSIRRTRQQSAWRRLSHSQPETEFHRLPDVEHHGLSSQGVLRNGLGFSELHLLILYPIGGGSGLAPFVRCIYRVECEGNSKEQSPVTYRDVGLAVKIVGHYLVLSEILAK